MKKNKDYIAKLLSFCAPLALSFAIMASNTTCLFFSYQPEQPNGIRQYKRINNSENDKEITEQTI